MQKKVYKLLQASPTALGVGSRSSVLFFTIICVRDKCIYCAERKILNLIEYSEAKNVHAMAVHLFVG